MIKQYLIQIKIIIAAIMYFGSIGLAIWVTNEVVTGKQAKQDFKIITTEVEEYNNALSIIAKNAKNAAKESREYQKRMEAIPLPVLADCDYSDVERLHNEAAAITNQMLLKHRSEGL
jgi:hypothetical protein